MAGIIQRVSRLCYNFNTAQKAIRYAASSTSGTSNSANEKFDQMVKSNKVVVFMKGVPEQPMCGFSNAVVQILRMHGVQYDAHNVLEDESIRQGLYSIFLCYYNLDLFSIILCLIYPYLVFLGIKEYTNWPTIPQVFIGGEFVGGCDILLQMHKNGELVEELQKIGIKSALLEQENKKE